MTLSFRYTGTLFITLSFRWLSYKFRNPEYKVLSYVWYLDRVATFLNLILKSGSSSYANWNSFSIGN